MAEPTKALAAFAAGLNFDDLPCDVVDYAKRCILDLVGVSLAGSTTKWARILVDFVRSLESKPESTVFASKLKSTSISTALANGTMAHSLELDDTNNEAILHPGSAIIPAAIAVAERQGVSGKELITSVVAGYEVSVRIALAISPYHVLKGFHPSGTCGVFGAAAATGNLFKFDESLMTNALGIAGSYAAGLMEFLTSGAMTKRLQLGNAAANGVLSASLAKRELTGPDTILEGVNGFLKAYSPKCNIRKLNRTLGHRYEILRTGFKQHACCRGFHSTIDGLYELIRAEGLKHADIARVVIGTDRDTVRYSVREPETFLAAQMSYPFSVASALVRGNCGVQSYNEDELKNREVLDLAKRIQLVVDHRVNESYPRKWGSRVNIVLRNGKRISKTFWHAKGEPEKPFTRKELDQKFVTLASLTHSSERVQAIMEAIHRLENLDNVSVLCLMLSSDTEHGVTPNVVRN